MVDCMNINSINVNKYPISQMFDPDSKTVFEVPKYQREYVWGTREWSALYHKDLDPAKIISKIEVTLKDRTLTQTYHKEQ